MTKLAINEKNIIEKLVKEQDDFKKIQPKYKYKTKSQDDDGFFSEVHEYECPNGEVGFQIFLFKDDKIKSVGYGQEAKSRTCDWQTYNPEINIV